MSTLHYIFDPLCGWCYAAAPLIDAARNQSALAIVLHGGGMLTGSNRRQITAQWRDYVVPHDRRIAQLSGQPFGERYFEDLLRDTTAVLDSEPPTTAILAAEEISGYGLDMLHRVQHAHYAEGRRIADHDVLSELANEIGLDASTFSASVARLAGSATEAHFRDSRACLARTGGQSFPTLALEQPDGRLARIDLGEWLGRPADFAAALRDALLTPSDEINAGKTFFT